MSCGPPMRPRRCAGSASIPGRAWPIPTSRRGRSRSARPRRCNAHRVNDIGTTQDAAAALRPIAGLLGELVFAAGIIGTGLLAVPTLAGSTAYAVGEQFGWTVVGLGQQAMHARAFYGTLAGATLLGMGMCSRRSTR
jgi:natural resistance-associated macrophage protein